MSVISSELHARVEDKILETIVKAETIFNKALDIPALSYELKGTTAGQAFYHKWLIKINPVLLKENEQDMIDDTVVHEIAHLITDKVYPRAKQAHGPEWKGVMRKLGREPSTYHSYDTSSVKRKVNTRRWLYECKGCGGEFNLSTIRHNRIQNKGARYWCKPCGRIHGELEYVTPSL